MKRLLGFYGISFAIVFITSAQVGLKEKIDSLNNVSFEIRLTDLNQAIEIANRALKLNNSSLSERGLTHYEDGMYDSYLNIGIAMTSLNKYDSAMRFLRECVEYYQSPYKLGLSKYYLGINYSNLSDLERARALFEESRVLFKISNSAKYLAAVDNSLGIVEVKLSNHDRSLKFFLSAYETKLENGLWYDEELNNISILYRIMGKLDESLEFIRKSLNIVIQKGDSLGIAQTYVSIGNTFRILKEVDSATYYYDKAIDLSLARNFQQQFVSALTNKADILDELNREDEAIKMLREAIVKSLNDATLASISHRLSSAYYDLEKYDSAIFFGEKAYRLSQKTESLNKSKEVSLLLSRMYDKVGALRKSNEHLRNHAEHLNELNSRNNQSQISDLRVRLETLEKDKEISILNKEKELDKLRQERIMILFIGIIAVICLLIVIIIIRYRSRLKKKELEHRQLEASIEKAKEDLYNQTLHMIHINNCMDEVETQVKEIMATSSDEKHRKILASIRLNKSLEKDWENFNDYFGSVHSSFYEKLSNLSNKLSNHERRVCALMKLNLHNREIATILNIEVKSVSMIKYRIKKKLKLDDNTELSIFIQGL